MPHYDYTIGYAPPKYGYIGRREHDHSGIGYADISSWSRGTTRPVRPNVPDEPCLHSTPIGSLKRLERTYRPEGQMPAAPHNPQDVVLPFVTVRKVVIGDLDRAHKIQFDFWKRLGAKNCDVRVKAR